MNYSAYLFQGPTPPLITIKQVLGETYPVLRLRLGPPLTVTPSMTRNVNRNPNPNVMCCELPPKSIGFFRGPCTTFRPNFMKIG